MAKKKSSIFTLSGTVNISQQTGSSIIINAMSDASMLLIKNSRDEEVLKITKDGDIYYNENGNMNKANCSDDVGHAFIQTVLQITTMDYETAILDWYTRKIMEKENSDEFLTKLERVIRKRKLEKLKK